MKNKKLRIQAIIIACIIMLIICTVVFFNFDNDINKNNIAFINSYGWQVEETPTDIAHITFPEEFDEVLSAYSNMISNAQFTPASSAGMTVTRYSYKVLNHRDSASGLIRINVFVKNKNIVSADISSLSPDGFILPISDTSGMLNSIK